MKVKRRLLGAAAILAAAALGGSLVVVSGVVPIKASSGHWSITKWFLNFAKRRSVVTHSLGVKAPALDEPALVVKGASHYETGCGPCHGSPSQGSPRIAERMTPRPPDLAATLSRWKPRQLFYIVKHGIKLTGMPAWPAQERDDEVWAVVAFLIKLPGMDAESYQRLVSGETAPAHGAGRTASPRVTGPVPRAADESCARCHGRDGRGRGAGAFPSLAGQKPDYLFASLEAFAHRARHSGIMEPIAAGLSREEMRELARHYASLEPESASSPSPDAAAAIGRGEVIARHGVRAQGVPACLECHGPSPIPRNSSYPVLAGQYPEYLVLQLSLFKTGHRGGTAYAHLMYRAADQLTPAQMSDVAAYYASLRPPRAPGPTGIAHAE